MSDSVKHAAVFSLSSKIFIFDFLGTHFLNRRSFRPAFINYRYFMSFVKRSKICVQILDHVMWSDFVYLMFDWITHSTDSSRNGFGKIRFYFIHQKSLCRVSHLLPILPAFFFLKQKFDHPIQQHVVWTNCCIHRYIYLRHKWYSLKIPLKR